MQQPIADVFTWPADDPQLLGSRCEAAGGHVPGAIPVSSL